MDLNAALSRSVLVIKNVTDQDAGLLEHLQHSANCYLKSRAAQLTHPLTVTRIHINANDSYALLGFDGDTEYKADDDLFSDLLSFCLKLLCVVARLSGIPVHLSQNVGFADSVLQHETVAACSQHFRYALLDHPLYFSFDLEMSECLLVLGADCHHVLTC